MCLCRGHVDNGEKSFSPAPHLGALAMRRKSVSVPRSTKRSAVRRAASGFADYVVEVLTAVQAGRARSPVISAFKA